MVPTVLTHLSVQLRPTVRNMAKALEYDVSLLERLYTTSDANGMEKTMLDVQYRSPRELNAFPSKEFYKDKLKTSEQNAEVANFLALSRFPWPVRNGTVIPTVFLQCGEEEDMGSRSKSNEGQVKVVQDLLPLLSSPNLDTSPEGTEQRLSNLKITVLSPYTKQIQALRHRLPSSVTSSTIDSFQGRESDIIIFSTVRCNVEGDVGFLDDPRRLNVMWTRARLALIIIGDRKTMSGNPLWKRALDACAEVYLPDLSTEK
jgi:superfamily I DNA and/or RNA helicase